MLFRSIRELIDFKPDHQGTDITQALRYFTQVIKKRCTAFLFTDFYDHNFQDALKIASRKHDLIAIRITDPRESEIPDMGLVKVKHAETGNITWVDTADARVREYFRKKAIAHQNELNDLFNRSGIDWTQIRVDEDYVKPLMKLFRKRESRK